MVEPLAVPELVQARAAANGAAGRRWLRELPEVVSTLAERWRLRVQHPYAGGTAAFVAAAVDGGGRSCVLKVAMPLEMEDGDSFRRSVLVHRLAAGRGCAELLEADHAARAMLLERLGPNLADAGCAVPDVLDAIARTMRDFWRPLADGGELPTGAEKAAWLAEYIPRSWEDLDRPCPQSVIERAVSYCAARADTFDTATAVLVHGDAHAWNTLDAGGGTYKFVDPEGLCSEPAHDLSVPMREYNAVLLDGDTATLTRARAEHLSALCDVDPGAVWQWGFVERVSTGLTCVRELAGRDGMAYLEVAERCL